MAELSYSVLFVCTLALVLTINASTPVDTCDEELPVNCCYGKNGSITAPSSWLDSQSPAGGPDANPDAVVCVLYRTSHCLVCRLNQTAGLTDISTCCTAAPAVADDTMFGGHLPLNEYLIGELRNLTTEDMSYDWYDLYPRHENVNISSYYEYTERTATGRSGLNLHLGQRRSGCETTNPATGENDCWAQTMAVLDLGNMTYNDADYSGFLYVFNE
ncbi:uncharacterized protein [Asterias amurensis]|uniref:uncharacterized protein n=1 Tax=Asterias amurensis TaxID=7602 RepID=UPI003AB44C5A